MIYILNPIWLFTFYHSLVRKLQKFLFYLCLFIWKNIKYAFVTYCYILCMYICVFGCFLSFSFFKLIGYFIYLHLKCIPLPGSPLHKLLTSFHLFLVSKRVLANPLTQTHTHLAPLAFLYAGT